MRHAVLPIVPGLIIAGLAGAALGAGEAAVPAVPAAPATPALAWTDLTDWVNGAAKGITVLAVAPDGEQVIVGLADRGLLASSDGRKAWAPLAKDQAALQQKSWPCQIVFDPMDAKAFWLASRAGAGLFATSDGGATLARVGNIESLSAVGVDFSDAKRKTLLACRSDKDRELSRSANGGQTFSKVGSKLPDKLLPLSQVVVLDAKTWLVASGLPPLNAKKKDKEREAAVYRTEDAGGVWFRVLGEGVAEAPLLRADGSLWWTVGGGEKLMRSQDRGKIWTAVEGATSCPAELPKGWLAAVRERQVVVSTNGGKQWQKVGPELSFAPAGLAYAAKHNCLFAWRAPEVQGKEALLRLDLPEKLELAVEPVPARDLMVWNGDEVAKGGGFNWPEKAGMTKPAPTNDGARAGKAALKFHLEAVRQGGFGWNWHGWFPKDAGTDISAMAAVVLAVRVDGAAKPDSLSVSLKSNNGKQSKEADLVALYPGLLDGQWHEAVVPLTAILPGGELDLAKAWEIVVSATAKADMTCDIYLDEVGFAKALP
jgi:hypothetical protein